jgi:hypothetical protein
VKSTILRTALWAAAIAGVAHAETDRPLRTVAGTLGSPSADSDLVFVVGGDNRPTGHGAPMPRVTRSIFEEIGLVRPDLVVWTGDTIYGYGDTCEEVSAEYRAFLGIAQIGKSPFVNSPGNHEIHEAHDQPCGPPQSQDLYEKTFGPTYGSIDIGGVHLISLDTETPGDPDHVGGAQLDWLKKDLEANKTARAIFVFGHTEFYSSPTIDDDAKSGHEPIANGEELKTLFHNYPVRAVFSGHEHLFWHEAHEGIDYFVTGGAGAPLYASPDRSGFSHYVVVRVVGSKVSWDLIQPGRLYVESKPRERPFERTIQVVNSNDAAIPLRGVAAELPAEFGPCSAISAASNLRKWDGMTVDVPVKIASCEKSGRTITLTLSLMAPRRLTVPITIRKRP